MQIQNNVSLANYSTMKLGGTATHLVEVTDRFDIPKALDWAEQQQLPVIVIGCGSNIVWKDETFAGLVIVNKIMGTSEQVFDENTTYLTAAGGENWDQLVEKSVVSGLFGIELLSKIPGNVGAAPVQNIGAYGAQLSDTLMTVEVYDTRLKKFTILTSSDCKFGYRDSVFKQEKGRYIITGITLNLSKQRDPKPYYKDIQAWFNSKQISQPTLAHTREAVVDVRYNKLPDPSRVANNGSFFKNPIIDRYNYDALAMSYPQIEQIPEGWTQPPRWFMDNDKVKLSAGWLVEQAGFKDFHDKETGMATWPTQSLVLVNENAKTTAQLLTFRDKIVGAVKQKFSITLEQEPELLP